MPTPLFKPFRALGYITDSVPFAVNRKGKETYVTVSVGKSWQVYNCAKLTLVLVGPQLRQSIRALACKGDLTFAAVGSEVVECKRVHRSGLYRRPGGCGPIKQLLVLGDLLLALTAADSSRHDPGRVLAWKLGEYDQPQYDMELPEQFAPTCFAHPDTYINKLLLGAESGQLLLVNFVAGTVLYTFTGWGSAVRAITPSPALDTVGIGLADGRAVVHNIKYDEMLTAFTNAAGVGLEADGLLGAAGRLQAPAVGSCTALAFRTGAGVPLMAAGGSAGVITVWDLEKRKLHTVIKDAHDAPLLCLHFFPGEPLLMSSAGDNSVKHWVFDNVDNTARLLKFRSGHSAPPTCIAHYGEGLRLLSAGNDRAFRVFSVHQDQQSRELSQHHTARRAKRLKIKEAELKLPRVIAMDACEVRERDWANVITAHEGHPAAYTWRLQHFTLGDHELTPPPSELGDQPAAPVTSVAMSPCGNFGIVGSASGRVDRYNMQSGYHRGSYCRRTSDGKAFPAHGATVTGLAVDNMNRLLVSAGCDQVLRMWAFKTQKLHSEVSLGAAAEKVVLHGGSCLAAVACSDNMVRMYDIEAPRLVRRFKGHRDRITSLHISADGRWLLSASMDGTLRCWDIPASSCLQVMHMGAPVTSLTLAPRGDLLATTHVNRRGIYLWSNQLYYGSAALTAELLANHSTAPVNVGLPSISTGHADELDPEFEEAGEETEDEGFATEDEADAAARAASSQQPSAATEAGQEKPYEKVEPATGVPVPLAPQMVTFSLLPRAQVESLVALDLIRERNKPIQPPKKPEAAPFFLPTVPGLEGRPVWDTESERPGLGDELQESAPGPASRVGKQQQPVDAASSSEFVRLLRKCGADGQWGPLLSKLQSMTPVVIDRELKSMQVLPGATDEEIKDIALLLEFLGAQTASATAFEFTQAVLAATLRLHGDAIAEHTELRNAAAGVRAALSGLWGKLDNLLQQTRCMVAYFGNLQG